MLTQGTKPSVRGVMQVTGGKTETVSKLLRDFNDKRNAEVLKMADELGSSKIAQLLADEVQSVVERKTASLQQMISDQKAQLDEAIELLEEKEKDCQHRIEMAEAKATQAINEANDKATKAIERVDVAELAAKEASAAIEQAKQDADKAVSDIENKCDLLVTNSKSEADSLVNAANRRTDKAEQESAGLRDQVTLLTVDQAKREIEKAQHEKTLEQHSTTLNELADKRTLIVQLQTQEESRQSEINRLTNELVDVKADSKLLAAAQGQLVELQRQISQLQSDLSLSERERESLSVALRRQ
ncbi:DNA-binding protein [Vibrio cortegadensis]|uniref:DNA-binding protein n=1 Tax=Vibrio cortegadensis TaxID=1328770 RepID=A0ABV4MB92_9VIBR